MKVFQYHFVKLFLFVTIMFAFANLANAQDAKMNEPDREPDIKSMIDAHGYVFKAQSVHPTRGRVVQLNSDYNLKISKDTVRSYLPYFGRAYSAPLDGRGGGIEFTSKNFEHNQNICWMK